MARRINGFKDSSNMAVGNRRGKLEKEIMIIGGTLLLGFFLFNNFFTKTEEEDEL